MPTHLATMTCV